jgi:hypothetical protein
VASEDNNSETSSSYEDIEEKYVASQVNNSESSNSGEIWNFGRPTFKCRHCKALLWYEERIRPNKHTKNPSFRIYCNNEKISLPTKPEPPTFLQELLGVDNQR